MKKTTKIIIIEMFVIILLIVSNYFSLFYHYKYYSVLKKMISSIIIETNKMILGLNDIYLWLSVQEFDFRFNNREKALGIIIIIFFIWTISYKKTRIAVWEVIKSLFNKHFIRLYLEIIIYTFSICLVLYKIHFWNFIFIKDTIVWLMFTSLYLSYKTVNNKGDDKLFYNLIRDSISITLIIEFLANMYTFSLVFEIIIIIIAMFSGVMLGFIESQKNEDRSDKVYKFFNSILVYIGFIFVVYILGGIISNWEILFKENNVKSFLLPIFLTLMFIPYLYYLVIRIIYQEINVYLKINNYASAFTKLIFRLKLFMHCKMNRIKICYILDTKVKYIRTMEDKNDFNRIFNNNET